VVTGPVMIGHLKTGPGHNAFFLSRFFVVGQVQSVRFVLFCIAQRKLVIWKPLAAFSLGWPRFWSWLSGVEGWSRPAFPDMAVVQKAVQHGDNGRPCRPPIPDVVVSAACGRSVSPPNRSPTKPWSDVRRAMVKRSMK
jgi:hypothetical protein